MTKDLRAIIDDLLLIEIEKGFDAPEWRKEFIALIRQLPDELLPEAFAAIENIIESAP